MFSKLAIFSSLFFVSVTSFAQEQQADSLPPLSYQCATSSLDGGGLFDGPGRENNVTIHLTYPAGPGNFVPVEVINRDAKFTFHREDGGDRIYVMVTKKDERMTMIASAAFSGQQSSISFAVFDPAVSIFCSKISQ